MGGGGDTMAQRVAGRSLSGGGEGSQATCSGLSETDRVHIQNELQIQNKGLMSYNNRIAIFPGPSVPYMSIYMLTQEPPCNNKSGQESINMRVHPIQLSLGALQSSEPEAPLVQAQWQHGQEKTPCKSGRNLKQNHGTTAWEPSA